jgi:hypothetical protein
LATYSEPKKKEGNYMWQKIVGAQAVMRAEKSQKRQATSSETPPSIPIDRHAEFLPLLACIYAVRTSVGIRSLPALYFRRPSARASWPLSRATSSSCHQAVLSVSYHTYTHECAEPSIIVTMSSEQELQINPVVQDSVVHNSKVRQTDSSPNRE